MKKIAIIGVVLVLVGVVLFTRDGGSAGQQVSKLAVSDTVIDFYTQWLKAAQEGASASPDQRALASSPILSKMLRAQLKNSELDKTPDPVLCQTVIPEAISTRSVFENTDKAQVLVMSKDKKVTEQALVTLAKLNEGWYINDISCSSGEVEPEAREFSFEKQGFLLKDSIPAPYSPKNWHLVFEENGELGHVVPLFFDAESQCIALNGSKSVCKPEQFTEATKVSVRGQMSERGVTVKQQEFVK